LLIQYSLNFISSCLKRVFVSLTLIILQASALICYIMKVFFIFNNINVMLKKIIVFFFILTSSFVLMTTNNIIAQEPPVDDTDEADGGMLPGAVITCSAGNSGHCFRIFLTGSIFDPCPFSCIYTGNPSDHCSLALFRLQYGHLC